MYRSNTLSSENLLKQFLQNQLLDQESETITQVSYTGFNIVEQDDQLLVCADLPGIEKQDLEIKINHDVLSITGQREVVIDEESKVYAQGQSSYKVDKTIRLPFVVDTKNVDAKLEHGVLTLLLPKADSEKATSITIH